VVAATFEKAITYVFAELVVRDREVGGSNPLAPTKNLNPINDLKRHGVTTPVFHVANLSPEMTARDV
jgi:hypothetical protein